MRTILVVDDHAAFRTLARALLEAHGYAVVGEASDGLTAIEAVRGLQPDVVLLDVGLPDIDGFEVVRRLNQAGCPSLVVLTSSRDAAAYGPRIATSGAAGFIVKDELSGPTLAALLDGA